jgi:hypothetical protein
MGMYPRPGCPDRTSSKELSAVDVDAWIQKVLDLEVSPDPKVSPIPVRKGILSTKVSMLSPISVAFTILSFHCARNFAQGHGGSRGEPWDANLLEDAAKREVKHAPSEETLSWGGEREISVPANRQQKGKGWRPLVDLGPLVRGKRKGGGATPPLLSPLCATPSPHRDAVPL